MWVPRAFIWIQPKTKVRPDWIPIDRQQINISYSYNEEDQQILGEKLAANPTLMSMAKIDLRAVSEDIAKSFATMKSASVLPVDLIDKLNDKTAVDHKS